MLVSVSEYLIVTDGVKMVAVNAKSFDKHWEIKVDFGSSKIYTYEFAAQNDLLSLKLCHYDAKKNTAVILATWNTALRVY